MDRDPKFSSNVNTDDATYTSKEYETLYFSHNENFWRECVASQAGLKIA